LENKVWRPARATFPKVPPVPFLASTWPWCSRCSIMISLYIVHLVLIWNKSFKHIAVYYPLLNFSV
jgi:hypothetical protein